MKVLTFAVMLSLFSASSYAANRIETPSVETALGSYDFAAPSTYQTSDVNYKVLGGIVYETSTQSFKGYTGNGNWVGISAPNGTSQVTSGGNVRIESARITSAGAVDATIKSSNWISSVTGGAGNRTLNFATGVFSTVAPSCTCSTENNAGAIACTIKSSSITSVTTLTVSTTGQTSDDFHIICVGK